MSTRAHLFRHRFSTMGCPAEVCLHAPDRASAEGAFTFVEAEVHRLDRKYSHYREDSVLAALQRDAARPQGVPVDEETAALLHFAESQYQESDGCFDITAGRLSALWDRRTRLPSAADIASALAVTGWHRAQWDGAILNLAPGMRLDLGGVVKEYAVDRAALLLRSAGHVAGYVDLGGDLHVLGPHPDGQPWMIGIRHPRGPGAIAAIRVSSGGLATSGDYERCSLIDGVRYSHLIDPRTGWPIHGLASASVVAPTCLLAGAMSTLALLLEPESGLDLLASSGLPWMAHDGRLAWSEGKGMLRTGIEPTPLCEPRKPLYEHVSPALTTHCC